MWLGEEKDCRRAKKLWKVDQQVLIPWVKSVLGKVGRGRVVQEVVEGGYHRVPEKIGPRDRVGSIKRGVECYCDHSCKEPGHYHRGEGQGPAWR